VILPGVPEAVKRLSDAGYGIVVITNQAGIAKGLYTRKDMRSCNDRIQKACGGVIRHFYYSPWHPVLTESLSRKPGSLLFEKAIARYRIRTSTSWMIGDKDRDLLPAKNLGFKTIQVKYNNSDNADLKVADLPAAADYILGLK
jgi:D-glycero-D-manno-heptose 1,7-bisphosphate phosphatase